jgi:hypothetical protein
MDKVRGEHGLRVILLGISIRILFKKVAFIAF